MNNENDVFRCNAISVRNINIDAPLPGLSMLKMGTCWHPVNAHLNESYSISL